MKPLKVFAGLCSVFVTMPIGLYITHSLIVAAHGDRLLFFLFWINAPLSLILALLFKLIENAEKD